MSPRCLCSVIISEVGELHPTSVQPWTWLSCSDGWCSFLYAGRPKLVSQFCNEIVLKESSFSEICILKVTTHWKHFMDKSSSGGLIIWKIQVSDLISIAYLLKEPSCLSGTESLPVSNGLSFGWQWFTQWRPSYETVSYLSNSHLWKGVMSIAGMLCTRHCHRGFLTVMSAIDRNPAS